MIVTGDNRYIKTGLNQDVIECVIGMYEQYKNQPITLVNDLRGLSVDDVCYSLFDYVLENVQYKEDPDGYQYVKTPARLLSDGIGDCKSMTIFIASCLHCLEIPHIIRFVNFDGGSQYTHVYPVAIDEHGQEIIVDCVERDSMKQPIYNYARPFKKKIDFKR